jgi:cardiolipin synthase
MIVAKQVADLITYARAFMGFGMAWLGLTEGPAGLPLVIWLLIADWTGDSIDGSLARRSRIQYRTWIGDHDLQVDMAVSVGLLIYLLASSFVSVWLALVYIIIWALVFLRLGVPRSLGMLFQAPIYAWFIWIAIRTMPGIGVWLVVWIAVAMIVTWPRFPREVIPGFISGMRIGLTYDRRRHDS